MIKWADLFIATALGLFFLILIINVFDIQDIRIRATLGAATGAVVVLSVIRSRTKR